MRNYAKKALALFLLFVMSNSACTNTLETKETTQVFPTSESHIVTSPQATEQSALNLSTSCWDIVQDTKNIAGSFIYTDRENERAFAWDLSTQHTKPIEHFPDSAFQMYNIKVSSDGSSLIGLNENQIVFISESDAKSLSLISNKKLSSGFSIMENGNIHIAINDNLIDDNKSDAGFTDEFYVLDQKTDEFLAYSVFLPDFFVDTYNAFDREYSSDFRCVVYRTNYLNGYPQYILLDIEQDTILWKVLLALQILSDHLM